MSAVVGILNKQAIAIAADSAVTVNGKIFNSAIKIFTLSKRHPVGIMIYNSGAFMNTPWETIIKIHRQELKDTPFNTLQEYADNFIAFLHQKNHFVDELTQKQYIKYNIIARIFGAFYNDDVKKEVTADLTLDAIVTTKCDSSIASWEQSPNPCPEFANYTIEDFDNFLSDDFEDVFFDFFTNQGVIPSAAIKQKLKTLTFEIIKNVEEFTYLTGLVFVGFGESQIFPSLISMNVHFSIQNRLKYYKTRNVDITHQMGSSIQPFAQTEAMNTILRGIAPTLDNIYEENFTQYITKYNERIIQIIEPSNAKLAENIRQIDITTQLNEYKHLLSEAKQVIYIDPIIRAVANLSKEDLAEMAESLIYLTYLQKRITFAAEDVGGAVDVAVISKGDGFIWIKRKMYFKPELNKFFFDNYFK